MERRTLNLGIVAHVDAGKTTLTERLLFAAGVTDVIGSVDEGTTQTDSLALEQRRGITIKAAVVSFSIGDVTVNLIDTPGHPDFIAEVDRVLGVLDGCVLVVSAVEGVQPQTWLLMRALQRLRVPTLIFVNKVDRIGANVDRVLEGVAARLTDGAIPMSSVSRIGTREVSVEPLLEADPTFGVRLAETLASRDDELLSAYVADPLRISVPRLRKELSSQTRRGLVHPVFCGSTLTGVGTEQLMAGIAELLPASTGDPEGPTSATVFKIDQDAHGAKVAYCPHVLRNGEDPRSPALLLGCAGQGDRDQAVPRREHATEVEVASR